MNDSKQRLQLAIETSIIMFLCAAGVASIQIFRQNPEPRIYYMILGIPACASAFYVGIAVLTGNLVNTSKLKFPYTVSLPLAFCSLLPVCSLLVSTPERGLVAPFESAVYAHLWQKPLELGLVLFMEVTALSLYALYPRS